MHWLLLLGCAIGLPAAEIMATTYPLQQLTRLVTHGEVGLLVEASAGCPHDHVLTVAERQRLTQARIIIANGAGLDLHLTRLATAEQRIIDTAQAIPAAERLPALGHGHQDDNPHFFTSPRLAARMVRFLGDALPDPMGTYRQNADIAAQRLDALARELTMPQARPVLLQHDALAYFARDAGLPVLGILQDEPGVDPPLAEVLRLTGQAIQAQAIIIVEPQYGQGLARTVGVDRNLPVVALDPVASGPAHADLLHYEQVMAANRAALAAALR